MRTPHPGWLDDSSALRARLVDRLEEVGAVRSTAVGEAFRRTPRELFVPGQAIRAGLADVYRNEVVVTATDGSGAALSSSSQPQLMAAMLENLRLEPGMTVLEVGTGTGYNAALLREIVGPGGRVVSVEVHAGMADAARRALELGGYDVEVVVGDGAAGHAPTAPYDRVVVTASSSGIAPAWVEQLGEDGIVEVPIRLNGGETQAVATFGRQGGRLRSEAVLSGRFMPLRGTGDGEGDVGIDVLEVVAADGARVRLAGRSTALLTARGRRALENGLGSGERRRVVGAEVPTWDLVMYVSLEVPAGTLVTRWPEVSVGVLLPGGGLAMVEGSRVDGSAPSEQHLVASGPPDAEERLAAVVRGWEALGRPGVGDLVLVTDGPSGSVRHHWRRPGGPSDRVIDRGPPEF